jgi:hypothetical protein
LTINESPVLAVPEIQIAERQAAQVRHAVGHRPPSSPNERKKANGKPFAFHF